MDINYLFTIDAFFIRLKHGCVSEKSKKILYNLVINLEKATDLQKEKFILVYNLSSKDNTKCSFSYVSRIQNCSPNAIRYSTIRVKQLLANLSDDRKNIFLKIIKNDDSI